MQNFQRIIFCMNTNIEGDFQICISDPLVKLLNIVIWKFYKSRIENIEFLGKR